MKKRGQVTVFIIFGIIILFTIFSFLFLKDYLQTKQLEQDESDVLELNLNAEKVKNTVEYCIEDTAGKAVVTLGFYGGKNDLVGPFFDEEVFDANYLYYMGEEKASSSEDMEVYLSDMMNTHLPKCVEELNKFSQKNVNEEIVNHDLIFDSFHLNTGEVDSSVQIREEKVDFIVNWPMEVQFKDQVKEMNHFPNYRLDADLHRMGSFLEDFMQKLKEQPYLIDVIYLLEQNYTTDVSLFNNDTYVFLVTDNSSVVNYEPLRFLFASKVDTTGVFT